MELTIREPTPPFQHASWILESTLKMKLQLYAGGDNLLPDERLWLPHNADNIDFEFSPCQPTNDFDTLHIGLKLITILLHMYGRARNQEGNNFGESTSIITHLQIPFLSVPRSNLGAWCFQKIGIRCTEILISGEVQYPYLIQTAHLMSLIHFSWGDSVLFHLFFIM